MKLLLPVLASAILCGALCVTGCSKRYDDGNLQVYHVSELDDVKTWDPANAYDSISLTYAPGIFETFYQYKYLSDTYQLEPLLAADLPKFSPDKLTLTIRLRHGIHFQDDPCFKATAGIGREVKAADFIYAFKRLALPSLESQGYWIFDGKVAGFTDFHIKLIKTQKEQIPAVFDEPIPGFQALDDYTLQIKLVKPYPQLLYVLAMTFTAPVAREAVEAYADEKGNLTEHPVGTGPFTLKRWARTKQIVMERNPTFHPDFYPTDGASEYRAKGMLSDAGKTLPFLDRVVVDIIREDQPRWLNFMEGKEDEILLPKDNFPSAISQKVNLSPEMTAKGVRLSIETGVRFFYVSFNTKDPVIGKNKYLRQALSSAIDRDKWIEYFTNGTGRKQVTALPPGILGRPENATLKYDFDLARAKELLKKAGYPEGQGLPVLNFDLRGADSVNRQMGDFFTSQFERIGVKLNVIPNTFPAFLEKLRQGNIQVAYGGWSMDYPDAENVYQLLYGPNKAPGPNEVNFDNPEMNALYEQLAILEPSPKRSALIAQADGLLQEEVPWGLGFYNTNYYLTQPWLENYRGSEIISNQLKYLHVVKETKKRYLEGK